MTAERVLCFSILVTPCTTQYWKQQPWGLLYTQQVSSQKLLPTSQRHQLKRKMFLVLAGHNE